MIHSRSKDQDDEIVNVPETRDRMKPPPQKKITGDMKWMIKYGASVGFGFILRDF